jgi:predicted acylesterase/phospholipase RssA
MNLASSVGVPAQSFVEGSGALVGLEQLAGTSAGAITAMALAVGYDAQGLRAQLDSIDFSTIADYGPLGELEIPVNLQLHRGATKGKALHAWIEKLLGEAPRKATKFGDLEPGKLQVVGVDLAHTRMVVFPEDVALYVDARDKPLVPEHFPIADAVRISAGYPYFFPPLSLLDCHTKKPGVLVDGGVASAFPVFLFDAPMPAHPTWGSIPTGDIPTLDFALTEAQKKELYDSGYKTAKAFFDAKPDGRNTYGVVPPNTP